MTQRIAIIGGGIAGLAFAVYYKKLGGRVDIYERSAKSGREGLGFIMLENGLKAMEGLGLREEAVKAGFPIEQCNIVDDEGQLLIEGGLEGSFGITRKNFVDVLLNEIPADWMHFDHEFSHFEWHEDESQGAKAAIFANGNRVEADFFIGSDGAGSPTRRQIFPEATRSDVKCKELVSIVDDPALVKELNQTFVKYKSLLGGLAVGTMPAGDDTVVWFVQFSAERYDNLLEQTDYRTFARELVGSWPEPIHNLIEKTDFSRSYLALSAYLNPMPRYHKGNVALMGDAAHALLPFTSQGVNSAIEDAIELANSLKDIRPGYGAVALEHYSVVRKAVVEKYLDQGIALQEEFLSPHQSEQKIPFAF